MKWNLEQVKEIMADLWKCALFHKESLILLQDIVQNAHKSKDPHTRLAQLLEDDDVITHLTTIRNKNLISYPLQQKLQHTTVAFFGLSVGSQAALTWIMQSRATHIKIVDPDTISPTNLNRLRFKLNTVARHKVDVVSEELLGIHPTLHIVSSTATDEKSMIRMLEESPQTHVVVDAIDDMVGKITLRNTCKSLCIPLVTAADVGDNVIVDIERYDCIPQPKPFLGRISQKEIDTFSTLHESEKRKLIIKLIGFKENSVELLESLLSIGKTLPTWPQLGATATIAGGVVTTIIKKICDGQPLSSGRYYVSLDAIFSQTVTNKEHKRVLISQIKEKFSL